MDTKILESMFRSPDKDMRDLAISILKTTETVKMDPFERAFLYLKSENTWYMDKAVDIFLRQKKTLKNLQRLHLEFDGYTHGYSRGSTLDSYLGRIVNAYRSSKLGKMIGDEYRIPTINFNMAYQWTTTR